MKAYLVVARIHDYYTSLTPLGIHKSYDEALDSAYNAFKNVQFSTEEHYTGWIFDSNLIPKGAQPKVVQLDGKKNVNEVNIAIIEYEVE
ncbi:hypothetical protein CPT_Minot_027 [Acinetobacter phage Minot]|nr:hypothetical protein CPT_Minot_027 [Acinetobacter phage Minot]QQO96479.1 hypothetical protein CPT_Mokit_028 [Acinetobacter phage Mokit]